MSPPRRPTDGDLKIDRPFWLAPSHVFRAQHLAHLAHALMTVLALFLIGKEYLAGIQHRPLEHGEMAWVFPDFHFDPHHWEAWAGAALLVITAVNSGLVGRAVRWKHQSVLLPRWSEAGDGAATAGLTLRWAANLGDIRAVLRFLEPAFPQKWYLPRPLSDREDLLKKLHKRCPRSILLLVKEGEGGPTLVGCSLIAPLTAEAYWDYRNGRADNWRFEQKDFVERSAFLLSNYLFCYRSRYRYLLRDAFVLHVAALASEGDPRVTVVGPRKSGAGKKNMARLGGHRVGTSVQAFPLYEL
jgi:hypothetical protein